MKHFLLTLVLAAAAFAQQRVEVTLERRDAGDWKKSDPAHVFANGDQIRFRFKSNFAGYLYVVNEGTSGDTTTLFPSEQAGSDNRVDAAKEYTIPSGDGAFKLTGPAGYDNVYWIVSPVRLATEVPKYKPLPAPPVPGKVPANMTPRCDDTVLRARGECVDSDAGIKKNDVPELRARELLFIKKNETAIVSAAPQTKGPFTYLFRVAHR